MIKMKNILFATAILLGTSQVIQASEHEVGCNLAYNSFLEIYMVAFTGVKGMVIPENYSDKGTSSVGVVVQKNNSEDYQFSGMLHYVKQGSRLEIDQALGKFSVASFPAKISVDEFKEIFGPVPNTKCYLE